MGAAGTALPGQSQALALTKNCFLLLGYPSRMASSSSVAWQDRESPGVRLRADSQPLLQLPGTGPQGVSEPAQLRKRWKPLFLIQGAFLLFPQEKTIFKDVSYSGISVTWPFPEALMHVSPYQAWAALSSEHRVPLIVTVFA